MSVRDGRGVARGLASAVVLTAVAVGAVASPASASCASADLGAMAGAADVALVGTVTSVDDGLARVRVSDVWRGSPGSVVEVDGGGTSAESVRWTVDAQYAVLADRDGNRLATDVCAGTRPVDDATLRTLDAELGPATPLGRGAEPADPSEPTAAEPTATSSPDGRATSRAAQDADAGLTTPQIALGIALGLAILASFLLPQLRRHHRERRVGLRDPDEQPPEPRDPRDSWR